ncbi:MAG: HPr family phosphocarrier protein [Pseudomonadota bacterium]
MKRTLTIQNEKGLHARAAAKLVALVEGFDADAMVSREGERVGGTSIMGLLMLAAAKDTTIDVETQGPEAAALLEAIDGLIRDRFGEGK